MCLIELLLHFGVEGPGIYFADRRNWLDFFLVSSSIFDVWVIGALGLNLDLKLMALLVSPVKLLGVFSLDLCRGRIFGHCAT